MISMSSPPSAAQQVIWRCTSLLAFDQMKFFQFFKHVMKALTRIRHDDRAGVDADVRVVDVNDGRDIVRIEAISSNHRDHEIRNVEKIAFSMKISIQKKLIQLNNARWWRVWHTDYLASFRRKFLIIFSIDAAVMGQRWGGVWCWGVSEGGKWPLVGKLR